MPSETPNYDFISDRITSLKRSSSILREKPNYIVFSALCVNSCFFKNPSDNVSDNEWDKIIVDSSADGGTDFLLIDPESEGSDLVIGQSKFQQHISADEIKHALAKMEDFYKKMCIGNYEGINDRVQSRYLLLNSELGDESNIHFVVCTSAKKPNRFDLDQVINTFRGKFSEPDKIIVSILFASDIIDNIKEAEARRPLVEFGVIKIDNTNNYLLYEEGEAAIINASAFSIKQLYATHSISLLSRNLRYHIKGSPIDREIKDTINNYPKLFWLKNNGLTIICDDYRFDGKEVKLFNFSIINGGQTTYMIHKNNNININNDFYLPCKIIKIKGENNDEKHAFSLAIAKATNSQKAITPSDLKANAPEQVTFSNSMRSINIFYQTKRGEEIPQRFKKDYLNTDLKECGKLCLAAIFQMPCASRNKPSLVFADQYYNPIFRDNAGKTHKICKELLYINYYFDNGFRKEFDQAHRDDTDLLNFAHNSRTICISFAAYAARYFQNNIDSETINLVKEASESETKFQDLYFKIRDISSINTLFPSSLIDNKDRFDKLLYELFDCIIKNGNQIYLASRALDPSLNATNFLKKDINYYKILSINWSYLVSEIKNIFVRHNVEY